MSLEGPLRELGLQEVCQLLSLSRKSGVLHVRHGRRAWRGAISVEQGSIVFAEARPLVPLLLERLVRAEQLADATAGLVLAEGGPLSERIARLGGLAPELVAAHAVAAVEAAIEELFTWRDGDFRFAPLEDPPADAARVRLSTDGVLMTAVTNAEQWIALGDRIAHAGMIPTFVEVEPVQLPLLHLVPQEWEVLTRVDGVRDIRTLALVLDRDALDVARVVHGLIAAGMLALRDVVTTERAAPTPPSLVAIATPTWVGSEATPPSGRAIVSDAADALASRAAQAARVGDFTGARAFWQAYLAARPWADDADRVREAIELVTRLDQLLADGSTLSAAPR
jgi:hypothetical protein